MGTLSNAFGFGSPASAQASGMRWGEQGTATTAFGDLLTGIGNSQAYGYATKVAQNNAGIATQNAGAALGAGTYEEEVSKLKYGGIEAEQKAAQAANGTDVNIGSPVAVRQSTANISAIDAAMIHYNAQRAAWGEETRANAYAAEAGADKIASTNALLSGIGKAGGTLLSGASSIGQKYAQWQYLAAPQGAAS